MSDDDCDFLDALLEEEPESVNENETKQQRAKNDQALQAQPSKDTGKVSEFSKSIKKSVPKIAPKSLDRRVAISGSNTAACDGSDDLFDQFSKLRIKNRMVSKSMMEERMQGRKVLIVDDIERNIRNNDIAGDWVVVAAIVEKQDAKTSTNGKKYCNFRLSNLRDCTMNLMLWDQAFAKHWKEPVGTVVAVLNPDLLKPTQKTSTYGLKCENPDKLMIVGRATDFGYCKSRKKDGAPCTMVINCKDSEFCHFHIQAAYKKQLLNRPQFASSSAPPQMHKRHAKSTHATYFIDGNLLSTEDRIRQEANRLDQNKLDANVINDYMKQRSLGSRYSDALKEKDSQIISKIANANTSKSKAVSKNDLKSALAMATASKENTILFSSDESEDDCSVSLEIAKRKAKTQGKVYQLPDQNQPFNRKRPVTQETIDKLKVDAQKYNQDASMSAKRVKTKDQEKKSLLGVDLDSHESQRLLNSSSRFQAESNQIKLDSVMKEFDSLEAKEKMMNKMKETTHLQIDCYKCKQCGTSYEYYSMDCKKKNHDVSKEKGVKRFFDCVSCHRKVKTINCVYPKCSCSCGSTYWTKSSMLDAKTSVEPEKFKARGVEHGKFLDI